MKNEKNITPQSFKIYGKLIHYPKKSTKGSVRNLWRIVHSERARVGWRIAYLVLRDKSIGRLECHPYSDETFEPVCGKALLFVSRTKNMPNVQCFLLDRPIVLNKGIWHGLISIGQEAEIKITENKDVVCRYWPLGSEFN
jgi:ureidoglycolate hydrolase